MISKVSLLTPTTKLASNKIGVSKPIINEKPIIEDETKNTQELRGVPYSYISFKGNEPLNFIDEGKDLISNAEKIARNYGHAEILPQHIIQAALNDVNAFLLSVDDGIVNLVQNDNGLKELLELPEENNFINENPVLLELVNSVAKKDILDSDADFEYFMSEIAALNEDNIEALGKLPKLELSDDTEIVLNKDLETSLKEMKSPINSGLLLGTAFNILTNAGITYTSEFLANFMTLSFYKSSDDINANHLKSFDERAVNAWNKLALGSSLFVTSKNKEDLERLESSLVNTVDTKKRGNFSSENTSIYSFNDDVDLETISLQIANIKEKLPEDNKFIFMINMDSLLSNLVDKNEDGTYEFKPELFEIPALAQDNVKLVLFQNDDSYFQLMLSPVAKKRFSNFINYSVPPLQSYEVNSILKQNKELLNDVGKVFTQDAREKAIILADKMDGAYPEKAVNLMKRISEYYGDEVKKISIKEVDEFEHIAAELFNKDTQNTAIIYDTGKTLATYYGKETTKKDIENIVKQIKTGRIGTQGFVIYSKDDEAGSGKKHTAKVIAGEAKVPFMEIDSSNFAVSVYDEDMTNRIPPANYMSKLFGDLKIAAKQNQYKTAVLYVNNFEEFALSGSYFPGYKQAMTQLSREMEKAINEDINILVIGGTVEYYAEYIPMFIKDFSQNIVVDSPAYNKSSRKEILSHIIEQKKLPLAYKTKEQKEELINKLVKITEYCSYVEIKNLINKTALIMTERNKAKASIGEFIEAYLQLETGRTSRSEMPMFNKEATTSHECGHATNLEVMNNLYKTKGKPWFNSRDVNFITLDPRGSFLGAVFEGKADNSDYPFEAMFSDLVCTYGGHSCEKEFFNMDGSSGISQDLAQATSLAKYGIEYYGLGYYTGKISNAAKINSAVYNENVYKDLEVILTNAQIVSDLITDQYRDFNKWFTNKYAKLIGSDNCMVDGEEFRKQLNSWIASRSELVKEELGIMEDIILDIIKATKNGKIYSQTKKIIK